MRAGRNPRHIARVFVRRLQVSDPSSGEFLKERITVMREPICRRRFLAISAATAAMGMVRFGWAVESPPAARPAADRELNDYLVAEISASALKANLALIRRELRPTTKLCFVAKANCYGHGWLACKDAVAPGADWVAVARPEEAIAVRQSGWRRPVILLMASGLPCDPPSPAQQVGGAASRERLRQLISQERHLEPCGSVRPADNLGRRCGSRAAGPGPREDRYRHDSVGCAAGGGACPGTPGPAASRRRADRRLQPFRRGRREGQDLGP